MSTSLYQDIILDHYRSPRNFGRLVHPTKSIDINNPFCGDLLHLEIIIKDNKIVNVRFNGSGCAISMASASLLTNYAKGKSKRSLQKLDRNFIIKMLGIELGPVRIKCALLALEGLKKLLYG